MFQYVSTLRSMTKGRAQYSMQFDSYAPVPNNVEEEIKAKYKPKSSDDEDLFAQNHEDNVVSMSTSALVVGFVAASGIMFSALKSSRWTTVSREPLLAN